jgi:hypothetical protein
MKLLKTGAIAASLALCACNGPNPTDKPAPDRVAATGTGAASSDKSTSLDTWREVTIPAGTMLPVLLDTAVGSDTSHAEEPVRAHLSRAVVVHGQTVLREGSRVSGVVTEAKQSGRVKGRAQLALRFDSIVPRGEDERYSIGTAAVSRTAAATKEKDALEIAAPAAGGAIIGSLVGGKKGALVGAGVGGGAGTAYVLSTRGKEVHLGRNAPLTLRLNEPLTVKVRG